MIFFKIRHQNRCFEIPTTSKHHLLIGKNKFMVIAIPPKFWHFPKIWHKTRCFEISTTSKHHLLIGKNKFMVIAIPPKFWHFPKIWHQTRCFEIPTTLKHHLLIGKNKFMVIAIHQFYIFRKLYSGCIIHFIASISILTLSKNTTPN